jgi:5-formyltetrahydrofolate cyclo-ligase
LVLLPPIAAFLDPKTVLREQARAERRTAAALRPGAARHAATNFLAHIEVENGVVVSLYHPIKDEIDPAPLAEELEQRGARLALPVIVAKKSPLVFRAYSVGGARVAGRFGTQTPPETAPEVTPLILVVPLLAFTRRGDRLGYGGGYYDRTLKVLRGRGPVLAVGYAYGAQEVDALPVGPLDEKLDWIVTEREAIKA